MAKEMLINVSEGEECRIALVDGGRLEELYMERTSSTSHVGNIYKGRVTNVEPSIQAAFVDFGLGRNGFLHISDLMPTYFGRAGNDIQESVGKKMARRDRPPIQRCLRRGDEIIVQIIKEGIGTKGPTLSTYLSIPGRILVMMPGMGKMGVSKKIEDEEERRRLRTILDSLKPPKGVGFIIRTAGIGKSKAEIQRDLTYLSRLWQQIEKKRDSGPGPMELYTEGDLVARTVRDVFSSDVERIVVDNAAVAKRVKEVIKITSPRTRNKVDAYEEPIPLFHKYNIEKDIELMYSRHVPLPSGGSLVIDSTEAIVAIDVNSGKFRDHSDAETTAFKTDMEAADEIPRQLKLRDLGGVIICDFIDLRYERHRRELEEKLHENFKKDRAKTKVLRMSQFGIIEITRQRMRPSLKRSIYFDCPHCKGAGLVKTPESMSLDVMRKLAIAAANEKVARIELSVCPDVSLYLLNKKRATLTEMERGSGKKLVVRPEQSLGLDEMKLDLFDGRDGLVFIDELGLTQQPPHTSQLNTRQPGQKGRHGRGQDRRPHGADRGGRAQPPPRREEELELDEAEDELEEREEGRERTPADDALAAAIAPKVVRETNTEPAEVNGEAVDEEEHDDADDNVVDVEDGHSELGDRPAGEWDRQYGNGGRDQGGGRGRRRRGRGRGGNGEGQGQPPQRDPQRDQQRGPQQRDQQRGQQQRGQQPQHNQRRDQRDPRDQRGWNQRDQRPPQQRDQRQEQQRPPQKPMPVGPHGHEEDEDRPGPGNEAFPNQPNQRAPAPRQGGGRPGGPRPDGPRPDGPRPDGARPDGPRPDGARQGGPRQGEGPGQGEEGGRRRRRRRGGRRHRRRRERERLAQLKAQGLLPPDATSIPPELMNVPYRDEQGVQHSGVQSDDAEDDEQDEQGEEPAEGRGPESAPEPARESEPESEPVAEAPTAEEESPAEEEEKEAKPAKPRRTRKAAGSKKEKAPAKKKPTARARKGSPKRTPPKSAAGEAQAATQASAEAPTKTGSTDRHLVDDEPVEQAPVSRPRRRYDLDAIPDDFD